MKNVTRFIAITGASVFLVALAKADEIQFTTLPQVVQSSVIKQTRITSPSRVVRVVQDNGIFGVTVMTDTGQQEDEAEKRHTSDVGFREVVHDKCDKDC